MSNLIKEIISIFVIVVIVQVILEFGVEEKSFFSKQIRFFGVSIIMSIIGGLILHWWHSSSPKEKKKGRSDDD